MRTYISKVDLLVFDGKLHFLEQQIEILLFHHRKYNTSLIFIGTIVGFTQKEVESVLRQRRRQSSLISFDPARVQIHGCHSKTLRCLCRVSLVYLAVT